MGSIPRAGKDRGPHIAARKWQYGIAMAMLLVGIAASTFLCIVLRNQEHGHVRKEFEQRSQDHVSAFRKTLDLNLLMMQSIKSFYASSQDVDRGEFKTFVTQLMENHPSIRAVQWAPRVPSSKRSDYEAAAVRDGYPGFRITKYDDEGKLVPVRGHKECYPVIFIEPMKANVAALGFDLAGNPACLDAMDRARDTDQPALTSKILLPDESGGRVGVRLFVPIYRNKAVLNTVEHRRENLEGFAVGVLRLKEIAQESLSSIMPAGIDIQLLDSTDSRHEQPLYLHWSRLRTSEIARAEERDPRQRLGLCFTRTLDVAGRQWTIICSASPQFIAMETTWYSWGAGAMGLLLTGLLVAYLIGIANRNARTANFAVQLTTTNQRLKSEIADRERAEERQARSLTRLEGVNRLQEDLLLPAPIEEKFKKITEAAVELLNLDFCRIWTVKPGDLCDKGCIHATAEEQCHVCPRRDKCLHLMASSGRYTHIDGNHRRVPLGCYKIGRIVSGEDNKFLTNSVTTDPRVHNHEWAKDLGLVSFAGYKLCDAGGDPIGVLAMFAKHPVSEEDGAFLSNLAEMTSRVIIDDKVDKALHASERRHRLFAENVSDVIWTLDFSGRFTYISPSLEQLLGFRWEEGMQLTVADVVTASSLAIAQETLRGIAVAAKAGQRLESRIELELLRKDGLTVWTDITANGMYDESGQIAGVVGITRDITERRRMEEDLRKAKDAAEAATHAKSRFLASMSHEIRTPMTAILGYADLLMDPTISASSRGNYAATIRRSGEHLLALINDILDFSKIEAGKMSLDVGRCNVVALLADVASMVRPRAEAQGVSFSVEYPGEMPETILTDGARLRQAIVNLAGNAVKFTERGSVRIAASVLPEGIGGQPAVRFEVIDTGIGIREDILPHLFQSFEQGDAAVSLKFGGTGLGLAISRHIAHLLGGDLTAASAWGQGSTFTLTVPAGNLQGVHMLQHPAEMMQESAHKAWELTAEDLKGVSILLAEDGYDNRELIKTILHAAGAEVETVENGRLAVDRAESESFDLILMDMNMPEMDGYEATRLLRDHCYEKPILALTANAMAGDSDQCLAAGCNEYLAKPIDRARLIQTIAKHVGKEPAADFRFERREGPGVNGEGYGVNSEEVFDMIVSQFIDDPDMAEIIQGFVGRLAGQLGAMRQTLADGQHEELRRLAHKLKGAGGSYGYPSLTDACKVLEDAAKLQDHAAAATALDTVATLIHAIEKGYCDEAFEAVSTSAALTPCPGPVRNFVLSETNPPSKGTVPFLLTQKSGQSPCPSPESGRGEL